MSVGEQVDFFIDGNKLKNVECVKYLGSYVKLKLDEEITASIRDASCVMMRLMDTDFNCRDLTVDTKL